MADNSTSQSQHFAPFTMPFGTAAIDAWRKAAEANVARMTGMYEMLASFEGKGVEQARQAIDEGARLMRESLDYATRMSAEWRKMSLEATRNAVEAMTPKA